jgi:Xaa-Pro aminopeptidase
MSTDPLVSRLHQLQQSLTPHQAFLLTNPTDITYYSGFLSLVPEEREAFLVVTQKQATLFHASFSPVPETSAVTKVPSTSPRTVIKHLTEMSTSAGLTEILIDKTRLFADEYEAFQKLEHYTFQNLDQHLIWSQRAVKDTQEIKHIRQASQIANQAVAAVEPQLKAGLTELDVQHLLEIEMIKRGSEKVAFPTIVCFGSHGALPHHQPTDTKLKPNTAILIDFGATVHGYRSDMTRSFWFGDQPSSNFLNVEKIVKAAYQEVITLLKANRPVNLTAADLDKAARNFITEAGFGSQFIHTTGHGVGLDIHEQPSINWSNPTLIEAGMILTVEPGIYIENEFGFRYENTVLITDAGVEELTL